MLGGNNLILVDLKIKNELTGSESGLLNVEQRIFKKCQVG